MYAHTHVRARARALGHTHTHTHNFDARIWPLKTADTEGGMSEEDSETGHWCQQVKKTAGKVKKAISKNATQASLT